MPQAGTTAVTTRPSASSQSVTGVLPLLEFTKLVNSSLDLPFVLGSVLLTLMGKLLVSKSLVLLREEDAHFRTAAVKGFSGSAAEFDFPLPRIPKREFETKRHSSAAVRRLSAAGITRLYPVMSNRGVVALLGIGERRDRRRLTREENEFVLTITSLAGTAIEKALSFLELGLTNRRLDLKVQELRTLFELSKGFNAILERERLIRMFALSLMGQIGASRYAICLRDGTSTASRIDTKKLEGLRDQLFALVRTATLVDALRARKGTLGLWKTLRENGIEAIVPLEVQNEVRGILCLGERLNKKPYQEEDLEFIYSLGNLAIISLENARLFREAVEKERLESELNVAREIQRGLLPRTLPEIAGFDLAAVNLPSKQVGGDYYDIIKLDSGRAAIVIGDVSGKGTPASLLMANVQAIVRTLVHFELPLGEMSRRVNHLVCENTGNGKFITFFWGILDPAAGEFRYVNAGHNHPFLFRRDGTVERLGEGGLILGVVKDAIEYREGTVTLHRGDLLVMFTDGVSEAMNAAGVDYTEERLERFLRPLQPLGASAVLEAVEKEITAYETGVPQSDDITLLILKRT